MQELQANAIALAEVSAGVADAEAIRAQFLELGRTCSACHQDFRKAGKRRETTQ